MRIGLVLHRKPSRTETFFRTLIEAWEKLGHEVIIFGGWEGDLPTIAYLPALPVRKWGKVGLWYFLSSVPRLLQSIRFLRNYFALERTLGSGWIVALKRAYYNVHFSWASIDTIHFGFLSSAIQHELVGLALHIPLSASIRGADIGNLPLSVEEPYAHLWPRLDKVHVLSKDLNRLAVNNGLLVSTPTFEIPPCYKERGGVDYSTSRSTGDSLQLAWVGRMTWKKNPELAISIIKHLINKNRKVHLTMVGTGEELPHISSQISSLGLGDVISLLGDLAHEQVLGLLKDADILIHTAWQEGFGNVMIEAQVMGTWVVAPPAEGVGQNIVPGVTGEMVREWRVEAYSEAVDRYLQKGNGEKEACSKAARDRILTQFSFESHTLKWNNFLSH